MTVLIVASGFTAGVLTLTWLGGRAYDAVLHRFEKRASDDTSWAYDDPKKASHDQ